MAKEDDKPNKSIPTQTESSKQILALQKELVKAVQRCKCLHAITFLGGAILASSIVGGFLDQLGIGEIICFSIIGFFVLILGVWVSFKCNNTLNNVSQKAVANAKRIFDDPHYNDIKKELQKTVQELQKMNSKLDQIINKPNNKEK